MKYRVEWQTGAIDLEVQTDSLGQEWSVDDPDGRNWRFRTRPIEGQTVTRMIVGETAHTVTILPGNAPGKPLRFLLDGRHIELSVLDPVDLITRSVSGGGDGSGRLEVVSVMPGIVRSVIVKTGDVVSEGQPLILLEAMKMENEITSPVGGKVVKIEVVEGATVGAGDLLAVIDGN